MQFNLLSTHMEEWTQEEFEKHNSTIQLDKRTAIVHKNAIRNIKYEDEIQIGFDLGFKNGFQIGKEKGRELAKELANK